MSEDITPAAAPAAPMTWEESPIAKVYNPDGSPRDGAEDAMRALGHEDFAGHTLRNGQDIFTALKTGKDSHSHISSMEKAEGLTVPTAESSDEDRAAFSKSLGVAENAEDFKKDIYPEGLPDDFQKDEDLMDMLADHMTKNPVNNADSAKDLVAKFITHQQDSISKAQEEHQAAGEKQALETKDSLTVEFGGTQKYSEFSDSVRDFATNDLASMGFKFELGDDGKSLMTDNPQHAAMLKDAPTLRLIKSIMDNNRAQGIPNGQTRRPNIEQNHDDARALYAKHSGNFPDQKTLKEYQTLRGINI